MARNVDVIGAAADEAQNMLRLVEVGMLETLMDVRAIEGRETRTYELEGDAYQVLFGCLETVRAARAKLCEGLNVV